ncbi:MAG TPA: hypothetical protein VGR73_12120 [Bryobacteraceae bacterium]|nr:hypothetical protein [Bryobacteraceae bacterium]
MSETKFGSWVVPEGRAAVEYSLVVVEEIRQAVSEGFQRFARGGIEVGGVLYGTYDGKTARILAVREIVCEHARGPSFILSDKDRAALTEQLVRERADPRLEGFMALGWFVSHTRSEIVLSPSDQETFEAFFPELWQLTLVVRPGRIGAMQAGFFVREADGTLKTERSYQDFDFPDRIAMPVDRPPRERPSSGDQHGASQQNAASVTQPESAGAAPEGRELPLFGSLPGMQSPAAPEYAPYPYRKKRWPWVMAAATILAAAVVAAGAIGVGLRFFAVRPAAEPISLAVYERDAQLRIEWNHEAAPVRWAARGTLEIVDGPNTRNVPLTPTDLARGSFTYARASGDVQVRLEVQDATGGKTQEASRFLGTPPRAADANELDTTQLERDALKDEVTRLRNQNAAEAERIQQLERTLTILRARLGILEPAKQ